MPTGRAVSSLVAAGDESPSLIAEGVSSEASSLPAPLRLRLVSPPEGVAKGREVDLAIGSQQSANSPEGAT